MHSSDEIRPADETPFLDTNEFRSIMTIHSATFQKLVDNSALNDQLADFFEDLGTTYMRIAARVRQLARKQ